MPFQTTAFLSTKHKFFNSGIFQRKAAFCTEKKKRSMSKSLAVPCPLLHPSVPLSFLGQARAMKSPKTAALCDPYHHQHQQPIVPHLPNHLLLMKTFAPISWVEFSVTRREREQKYQLQAAREQDDVFHLIWHANYQITSRYKGSVYI